MLTRGQREDYDRDGFLVVHSAIDAATVAALRARLDAEQEAHAVGAAAAGHQAEPGAPRRALRKLDTPAAHDPLFAAVCSTPLLVGIARELTGGGDAAMLLYGDQVFCKPAGCGSAKPLHQDNSYFRVDPVDAGVTCWIAIDDATPDNGCMRYIPGSYRRGLLRHREIAATPHLTPEEDGLGDGIPVPIPAGACIFHHLLALHSSRANTSDRSRRAYAIHYANGRASGGHQPLAGLRRVG